MIERYPMAGGEFTYAQKSFGDTHAFECSWFLGIFYATLVPLNATALALIGAVLWKDCPWLVDMSSLGAAIGYAYTSAAAFKHAKAKGDKGMMATGWIGSIAGIIFAVLLLVPIPEVNCSLGKESYICLAVWIVLRFLLQDMI